MDYVIGVDVGGTNTDTAILCGNRVIAKAKSPTTGDKTNGVINSIKKALQNLPQRDKEDSSYVLAHLARVSLGTTRFTNAVKERDGKHLQKVAVIRLCGSASRSLPPFVDFPGDLIPLMYGGKYLLDGGLEYNGKEISPLNDGEIRRCVQEILKQDPPVRNVVISGIFSPCVGPDDNQEKRVEEILKEESPELSCTLSRDV